MGLPKCITGRPMWRRMEQNEGPHLDPPDLTRWHTLCPHVSLSSHTHTYQHKHHTHKKFLLVPLFPPAYTHSREWNLSSWRHIRLSLSRPLSFLVPTPPPPAGPSIHASLEYIIHTHTSLGPTKYINTHSHMLHHVPHWSKKPSLHIYFAYNIPFE